MKKADKVPIDFYISSLSGGGAEHVLICLAAYFAREGYRVSITSLEKRPQFYNVPDNVKLYKQRKVNGKLLGFYFDLKFIKNRLRTSPQSVAISFMTRCNILLLLNSIFRKNRVIVCDRNNPLKEHNKLIFFISCKLYQLADVIIVQTNMIKKFYPKYLHKKISVIENPLDTQALDSQLIGKVIQKENIILTAGRLEKQKDFYTLIRAFEQSKAMKQDWKLCIFGQGNMKEEIESYITEHKLENKIILCGASKQLFFEMKKAKIFVLSSFYEGFPNVLCEAMYAGLSVISTDCISGPSELIVDGANGFLVPIGDVSTMSKRIDELADNSNLRDFMGRNALERVDRLNISDIGAEWISVIQKAKKVLVITSGGYPFGSPAALRLRAFVRLFQECGWNVVVYSDQITSDGAMQNVSEYRGAKIYGINTNLNKGKKIVLPLIFRKRLKKIIQEEKPDLVFSNCLYDRFSVIQSETKNKIPLIIQSYEWYDPSTFKFGYLSHHYVLHSICWKYRYPKANGVVAISRLLEKYYSNKIKNVIRIPTIIDEFDENYRLNCDSNNIRLLFAGSLARTKDSIIPFFEALKHIGSDAKRIQFNICGISHDELRNHLGIELYSQYHNQINEYGKIPQSEINRMYILSDYGIFFRPNQRSSHAGFSTKLGEGMTAGTPFIVNDTSDISLYIKNGENGFIVNNEKDIAQVYLKILTMTNHEKEEMRSMARKTAITDFSYLTYVTQFENFIDDVLKEYHNEHI